MKKFFNRLFRKKQVTPAVQQPPQTKPDPDEDTITITTKLSKLTSENVVNPDEIVTIKIPKITSVNLPKSEYFNDEDVKEFEEELLKCSNCTDNCKGRKLARYIVETGLDEFVRQKHENCLPEDIADAFSAMGMLTFFSYDGATDIFDKLKEVCD